MAETTTIRLPPKLRARLRSIAKETHRSVHSLILEAVEKHAAYEEQMRSLVKEALEADKEIDKTGEVYRAEECTPGRSDSRKAAQSATEAVAQVVYSARAVDQIERAIEQLRASNPDAAVAAVVAIRSAVENSMAHPHVGRRVEEDLRELVVSYGATGYIALYRFVVQRDEVRVFALRHQREIGYLP